MKVAEGLKQINDRWIVKPEGFRVRFQTKKEDQIITDYSPGLEDSLLDSDVVAWRYAWKLCVATQSTDPDIQEDELANITVVNDKGEPVPYYATNQLEIFNAKPIPDNKNIE